MKDLWITEIWRHGNRRGLGREEANRLFGYNESVGMECPLVWKEGRKRIKSGESVRWHLKDGYARISFPNLIVVHRLVSLMNSDYDYLGNVPMVDHIDNNKLNNFASNLRFVSISQNARNTRKRVGSSSRFHHV